MKKSKSWGPFESYQLNSTANPAQYLENGQNVLSWECCLADSSKTAPRILIFSIAMGANYSFQVKNIEIWVPEFFKHNNSSAATVDLEVLLELVSKELNHLEAILHVYTEGLIFIK